MKRFVFAFMFVLAFVGFAAATVSAAGPAKPVIEGEMPDCYMTIGGDGIILFTNASVPDGGTLKYQWYVTDIENMAMIRAIDYAEGDSYRVPEELGVKWYCYAAWNVVGGLESEPIYSRLIRVEFYENSPTQHRCVGLSFIHQARTVRLSCQGGDICIRRCRTLGVRSHHRYIVLLSTQDLDRSWCIFQARIARWVSQCALLRMKNRMRIGSIFLGCPYNCVF